MKEAKDVATVTDVEDRSSTMAAADTRSHLDAVGAGRREFSRAYLRPTRTECARTESHLI